MAKEDGSVLGRGDRYDKLALKTQIMLETGIQAQFPPRKDGVMVSGRKLPFETQG